MMEQAKSMSPSWKARIAGLCYLLSGLAFSFAEFSVCGKLIIAGDAAATARNIVAHQTLFRLGFAAELIETVLFIAVTWFFLSLFKPVNKSLAWLAAFFSLTGCTVYVLGSLLHLAPLILLGGAPYLSVFKQDQLQAMALAILALRAQADNIYMVFFGCYNFLFGCLIVRSTFLPRILGVFLAFAGLAYQTFLWPPLAASLFSVFVGPAGALGELSLVFWLLVFGVNTQKWQQQADAAGSGG